MSILNCCQDVLFVVLFNKAIGYYIIQWEVFSVKFNENGIIDPGLHTSTISDMCDFLVKGFETSQTRERIFDTFLEFVKTLFDKYEIYEIWVDGSFTTAKINPNDIDIVIFFYLESFKNIIGNWGTIRSISSLDAYPAVAICDDTMNNLSSQEYVEEVNNRNYWKGQFGYSREDIPKGIIILKEDELKTFVGGGSDVDDDN